LSSSRQVLLFGGLALAAFGMLYGLHYAVLGEHQALSRMGGSLAGAFVQASNGNAAQADSAIGTYAALKYEYVRRVDVHSHWIGLAMLMIVFGAVLDRVALGERVRFAAALAFLAGSVVFPLGVLLQSVTEGARFASGLAIFGAALVTASLTLILFGLLRDRPISTST
jgi:hypothetical protein